MFDIVWSDVTDLAPELSTVPIGKQDFILARVNSELSANVWGKRLNMGRVYLAAHLASRKTAGTGAVTGETVGSVSRQYATPMMLQPGSFFSTVYGEEYMRLVSQNPLARFALAPPGSLSSP